MAFEQRDNSESLWVSDRKSEDNHPDRTGTVMVNGALYFCNGWLRKTKDGKPRPRLAPRASPTWTTRFPFSE
jgi:hypothetical protein